jgi:predicted transcriptional regulator
MKAPTKNLPCPTHITCPRCGGKGQLVNGEFLRFTREEQGLSLREMARRLKYSATYLSDIEHNRRVSTARVNEAYGV